MGSLNTRLRKVEETQGAEWEMVIRHQWEREKTGQNAEFILTELLPILEEQGEEGLRAALEEWLKRNDYPMDVIDDWIKETQTAQEIQKRPEWMPRDYRADLLQRLESGQFCERRDRQRRR